MVYLDQISNWNYDAPVDMPSAERHEQTRHPTAPTLLQHRQVQCKGLSQIGLEQVC